MKSGKLGCYSGDDFASDSGFYPAMSVVEKSSERTNFLLNCLNFWFNCHGQSHQGNTDVFQSYHNWIAICQQSKLLPSYRQLKPIWYRLVQGKQTQRVLPTTRRWSPRVFCHQTLNWNQRKYLVKKLLKNLMDNWALLEKALLTFTMRCWTLFFSRTNSRPPHT